MKTAAIGIGIITLIGGGIFIGCGGSGGNGGGSSTVSAESIAIVADKIAQVSGCTKVSVGTAPLFGISMKTTPVKITKAPTPRAYPISYTKYGSCGGTLDIEGTHNNGTDTLTAEYCDHCSEFQDRNLIANGKTKVVHKGTPGIYGPVVSETTISTSGGLSGEFTQEARTMPATYQASLQGYSIKFSGGNRAIPASASSPNSVTISSAYFVNEGGEKYSVNGLKASTYVASRVVKVLSGSTKYTDPDVGTFSLTTNGMDIPLNNDGLPTWMSGEIQISGGDGTTGVIKATSTGIITITSDSDASAGAQVDCSQFLNDIS